MRGKNSSWERPLPALISPDRFARLICLLLCAGVLAALFARYPHAAPIPLAAIVTILVARRTDPKGGLLFVSFLSILALLVYGVCLGGSFFVSFLGGKVPVLAATLVVLKEFQRFLDNEYGDGRLERKLAFVLLAVLAGAGQVLLVWVS